MKLVWLVVLHFNYQGNDISVLPLHEKQAFTTQQSCSVSRDVETARWASISNPKPTSIACERVPISR